eukprot:21729-Prorocentrum_minimum.AAC.1
MAVTRRRVLGGFITGERVSTEWKSGRVEEWKSGRVEEWKSGGVEEWKSGTLDFGTIRGARPRIIDRVGFTIRSSYYVHHFDCFTLCIHRGVARLLLCRGVSGQRGGPKLPLRMPHLRRHGRNEPLLPEAFLLLEAVSGELQGGGVGGGVAAGRAGGVEVR